MNQDILEFIKRRFPVDCNWCNGNCYWFSMILHIRFPEYPIWLFQIENHFMIGDGEYFYDWKGVRCISECKETPIRWDNVKEMDELYYSRLVRDCIN